MHKSLLNVSKIGSDYVQGGNGSGESSANNLGEHVPDWVGKTLVHETFYQKLWQLSGFGQDCIPLIMSQSFNRLTCIYLT